MRNKHVRKWIASVAMLAASLTVSNVAQAADLLMDPQYEAPEIVTQPAGGWYLRGDISYESHSIDEIYYGVYADPGNQHFTSGKMESSFGLRGGIGYQINENFRVDATAGYKFSSNFTGTTGDGTQACPAQAALNLANGVVPNTTCTSTDEAAFSAYTLMANAYVDLGQFSGFTPYIGAGIGGAYVMWDSLSNTFVCDNAGGGNCGQVLTTVIHEGDAQWRFAYAFHAGVSYDVSSMAKLDFGYSYEQIAGGRMFGWEAGATGGTNNKAGPQGHDRGITDHVFRIGLRYQIW